MGGRGAIPRRGFMAGALLAGLGSKVLAQGFAGLGEGAVGFEPVVPGKTFSFPADHGPHPAFRIEWWYVTANLVDSGGTAYGAQRSRVCHAGGAAAPPGGAAHPPHRIGRRPANRAATTHHAPTHARG